MRLCIRSIVLFLLFSVMHAYAAPTVTIRLQTPTTNADGTKLRDLAGYHVYWAPVDRGFPSRPSRTFRTKKDLTQVLSGFKPARYKMVGRAFDTSNNVSKPSNEIRFTIPTAGKPPPAPRPGPVPPRPGPGPHIATGRVTISDVWTRVRIPQGFRSPIVVASPASFKGGDPGVVRLRRVNTSGFDIRFQEWSYLDEHHTKETVYYLVVEKGHYVLAGRLHVEAGTFDTPGAGLISTQNFRQRFPVKPVVVTSVVTEHDRHPMTLRLPHVSSSNFTTRLQLEERSVKRHKVEQGHYVAWQPGVGHVRGVDFEVLRTARVYSNLWRTLLTPRLQPGATFVTDMQSMFGTDTATVRYRSTTRSIQVHIDEERSKDRETFHIPEVLGLMIFNDL